MVTEGELLAAVRELVADIAPKVNPALATDADALRARVDELVSIDAPLQQFGWDSVQMTWLLVRLEERYDIDTSHLSVFDMFTVGDLLRAVLALIHAKPASDG